MFKTYIKVAVRNLLRNRVYAIINIVGLSAGIACSLIVMLYIQNELTYDLHHEKHDRIYRLGSVFVMKGELENAALSSPNMGPLLMEEYPEIEAMCRLRYLPRLKVSSGEASFYEERLMLADSTLFDVFTHHFIYGDPDSSLTKPNSIVLTASMAQKYFGNRNPVGDTLTASNQFRYAVTGVIEDLPDNAHHRFEGLLSYSTVKKFDLGDRPDFMVSLWALRDFTFLLFPENYNIQRFYDRFPAFYDKYMEPVGCEFNGYYYPYPEKLTDVHMNPKLDYDFFTSGNRSYIYAFSAIGLFILLLACINYINMATARSVTRAREVGIRKVMGSRRRDLVFQFLGESLLLSFVALLLGLGIAEVVLELTPFNALMEKNLQLNIMENPVLILLATGMTVVLGILSGLYPAFYMSAIVPVRALRGKLASTGRSLALRKGLVIFQFTISIGVIISTFLMQNQVSYMRNVDLGFCTDKICVVPVSDTTTRDKLPEIRAKLEAHSGVRATTTARNVPAHSVGRMIFRIEKKNGMHEQVMDYLEVGHDYINGMGLDVVEGRGFAEADMDADSNGAFLVNETAARMLFGGEAIGKKLEWGLDIGQMRRQRGPIVGVVRDFNVHSLHYEMRPLVLVSQRRQGGMLHIRLKEGEEFTETMDYIRETWEPHEESGSPFNYFFIDESFDKLYETDQRQSSLIGILAYICIIISILGLLGFASYSIAQRKREIGIRKVMGASTLQIMMLLFKDILYLIFAASMIGSILSFLLINAWLTEYAYHAEIPVAIFFYAGLAAMLIAFLTVSYHSLRAATSNPVRALKYE